MNRLILMLSFLMGVIVLASNFLVQLYTGMVYQGPNIVSKISNELIEITKNHGVKNISELIGIKK